MTPAQLVALLLTLAVVVASGRWLWRAWRADAVARPRAWRLALLLLLHAGSAVALYFALYPPPGRVAPATLVVITSGISEQQRSRIDGSDVVVAMPEAPIVPLARRVPDLGTALRQNPGATRLRIVGQGLTGRDRDAVGDLALEFDAAPLPVGIIELQAPTTAIAGAPWRISGRVNGAGKGSIEFLDPSGQRLARQSLAEDGTFAFATTARVPGRSRFQLRLRDASDTVIEELDLPLSTVAGAKPRLRIMAGAPSPELKYLRRWASDAGLRLESEITLSPGVRVADAPRFDAAALAETGLLILDDRVWSNLGEGQRALLVEAVRGGLGVLLRITAPPGDRERTSLRSLGFELSERDLVQAVTLAGGDGTVGAMTLSRRPLQVSAADGAVLLRDARGDPLSLWRAEGRGRIGLWWLSDSYSLVLAGQGARHAALWSAAVATLGRAGGAAAAPELMSRDPRPEQRLLLCDVGETPEVTTPEGKSLRLLASAVSGRRCAAFWPQAPGWHQLRQGESTLHFVVGGSDDARGLAAFERRQATRRKSAGGGGPATTSATRRSSSPWPWLSAWLALSAALWGLERSRWGRATGA